MVYWHYFDRYMKNVTNSFNLFMTEIPETGKAYMDMVMKQSNIP